MRRRKSYYAAFYFPAAVLVLNIGCSRRVCDMKMQIDAKRAGMAAIAQFDSNKDGKIDGEELDKCPGLKAAIPRLDPDGQGYVTSDAITKRIKQWQESRMGKMPIICFVMHNGKPLEGAHIRFVPEKFLGDIVPVSLGETNQDGKAKIGVSLGVPQDAYFGVPPGFYRVEITKPGVNIPAKYNTKTVLGVEVAGDSEEATSPDGIKLDLDDRKK
jgi:hypothetical protein